MTAVLSMKGQSNAMDLTAAIGMIRATAPDRRSRFAKQIWQVRRKHATDRLAKR